MNATRFMYDEMSDEKFIQSNKYLTVYIYEFYLYSEDINHLFIYLNSTMFKSYF